MHTEEIEKFIDSKTSADTKVKIDFKKRDAIYGLFVKDKDYDDLKSKNLWRIVPKSQFEEYSRSNNMGLAKIFNGVDFSRLTVYKEKEVV
ncbi:short-chain dehydrogenase [Pinibacter soli]|uniref:Short-chain dehydrogenase n=1 Tax=Pinibacter soli TaxID=3044211 RepID=A0ABT6RJQ1_9BACT|nr:short-chain dehydrogenase [Pinibacter soli]MDI3322124.1 short-chain dehydrogenase [Pinibacter soli]